MKINYKKWALWLWKEWGAPLLIVAVIVIPVKTSLADWYWVPSGSMTPTILEGDMVFVDKLAYDLKFPATLHRLSKWADPQRGDIIVCFSPDDNIRLVKRVIGIPGDNVQLFNNILIINGERLDYSELDPQYLEYLSDDLRRYANFANENLDSELHPVMSIPSVPARRYFGPVNVPEGQYFIMGDNRDNSRDSRVFGFVNRRVIIGKAKGVILSFDINDKYQPRTKRFFSSLYQYNSLMHY